MQFFYSRLKPAAGVMMVERILQVLDDAHHILLYIETGGNKEGGGG
jgi:hypothetical protein